MTNFSPLAVTGCLLADRGGAEDASGSRYLERETGGGASFDRQEVRDPVDEVGHGSFPASDPPSWTGGIA